MLFGCSPSEIKASRRIEIPAGAVIETGTRETWTMPETSKYTIPADAETGEAGGPGAMATTASTIPFIRRASSPVIADGETATPRSSSTRLYSAA